MQEFNRGQRWVSDTESELGLGTITEIDGRTIKLVFPASGEIRSYATRTAPLTRVEYAIGETAKSQQGWILYVEEKNVDNGLITYTGTDNEGNSRSLHESELDSKQIFSRPQDRLLRGQLDKPKWFDLRYLTLQHIGRLEKSRINGLCGIRAELLPHQLYIAHEVANRIHPRVLLADEVGLGKTIEAGMIIHQQLLTGRASRIMILVPAPLLHQWLVELLRRFNLHFRIFDEERCLSIEENGATDNPFMTEQLVLGSLDLFLQNPVRHTQALNAEWDLLVVDEAHHLAWDENHSSNEYRIVEQLAQIIPAVLLLTATPEQLGKSGHFARLRLLDPDRFHDISTFESEETHFTPIADAVELLLGDETIPYDDVLEKLSGIHDNNLLELVIEMQKSAQHSSHFNNLRDQLIQQLIDRHGTGRVMFRNSRARIKGFPQRIPRPQELILPDEYDFSGINSVSAEEYLHPERIYQEQKSRESDWWNFDPRIDWLVHLLKQYPDEKILLICAHAQTVLEIEHCLRTREGILSAVFHENMSIIERDRAAAWFSDPEEGTQLLLCSEIGSEGRNFQFSHHLVLFDLPFNPDLLEQRIGRLDRIGQNYPIELHIPYFSGSATETLFQWYQEGLNALERTCPEGHIVFMQLEPALTQALADPDPIQIASLLESASTLAQSTRIELESGRDHLLELSSCRQPAADQLVDAIKAAEMPEELNHYIGLLCHCYGLDQEEHSARSQILRPTSHMTVDAFPALPADGMTITTDRNTALIHEDRQFLSWEHPMIRGAMDLILSGTQGKTGLIAAKNTGAPSGLYLEALFVLETIGPRALQAGKFLPPTTLRVLINSKGENVAETYSYEMLANHSILLEKKTVMNLLSKAVSVLPSLVEQAETAARKMTAEIKKAAIEEMLEYYTTEIQRITTLQQVNPLVRDDEIEEMQIEGMTLHRMLEAAQIRIDATRVVILA